MDIVSRRKSGRGPVRIVPVAGLVRIEDLIVPIDPVRDHLADHRSQVLGTERGGWSRWTVLREIGGREIDGTVEANEIDRLIGRLSEPINQGLALIGIVRGHMAVSRRDNLVPPALGNEHDQEQLAGTWAQSASPPAASSGPPVGPDRRPG